jgi:hypothetical protein
MKRISNKARLERVLLIFDAHYLCSTCQKKAASHLEDCANPLHELHEELYRLRDEKK